jgi:hypothetical protein
MPDINAIMPPILAICGVSLLFVWPLKMRSVIRKYASEHYHRRLFSYQCLLSSMPLLEWLLFVIWTQPGMRAAIIGVITCCFVFYFLLAMRDTQIIQEISSQRDHSIKELKNMLNICYMMRSFYIFLALINIFLGVDLLRWAPPLGSAARQWLTSSLYLFAIVLSTTITLIETQLISRRQKQLKLIQALSPDVRQME